MFLREMAGLILLLSITVAAGAQTAPAGLQTEADAYTRYELLQPETASFKIYYEITATTAGATVYYNPIRKGSVASDENVYDAMSGKPLHFEVVHGNDAKKDALMSDADPDTDYIKVTLARPVPKDGQGRVVIVKTYRDAKSYFREGNAIVFKRSLGIPRNKIVLPPGYELVECNVPSQVLSEKDGRVAISFMHAGAGEAPLQLKAIKGAQIVPAISLSTARSWESPFAGETENARLSERAHQDRDIIYFLQQPETHAFSLFHDYTESRPSTDNYVNVVRGGSKVSNPSAYILDTGEKLPATIMSGAEVLAAKLASDDPIDPKGQVVVVKFSPVQAGQSIRLRISETYTAPSSYRIAGDELVFDRSLGRPRNAVVLPPGWYCTANATPATVSQLPDGRIRLDYWDDQPDAVDVLVKARRRVSAQ
jgi:hypothetical protein